MPHFTPGELAVMRILWNHGELKPADIQQYFPAPIKNPALRSYLKILHEKGHVTRRKVGKAFIYKAVTREQTAFRSSLREMVEAYCDGSMKSLVLNLIRAEKLSEQELLELKRLADDSSSQSQGEAAMNDFHSTSLSTMIAGPLAGWLLLLAKLSTVLALAWIAHLALRSQNPRWRILLWRAATAGMAAVTLLAVWEPLVTISWPSLPTEETLVVSGTHPNTATTRSDGPSVPELLAPASDAPLMFPLELGSAPIPHINNTSVRDNAPVTTKFRSLQWGLWLMWSIGVVLGLLRLAAGIVQVQRVRRRSKPVPDWITREANSLLPRRQRIELRQTEHLKTPCSVGIIRNTILLPINLCDETHRDEVRAALAHEIAHFQGHDLRWNHLLHVSSILLWFHPLAWRTRLAHADACDERCDAEAARQLGDRLGYGRSLARLALTVSGRTTPVALSMARRSTVTQRILLLAKGETMHLSPWRALIAAGLFGTLMLLVGIVGPAPTNAADDNNKESSTESHEASPEEPKPDSQDEKSSKFPFKKTVRVVDPKGEPIAGATVEPWAIRSRHGHGAWTKKGQGKSEPPVLATNAEGIAVIPFPRYADSDEKIPPRELTCRVVHPDFAETMYNDVPVTPDKRDEVTTITLHPGAIVEVEAISDGQPLPADNLYAITSSPSKNWFRKISADDDGRLLLPRLPAGKDLIHLVYLPDDKPPQFSAVETLNLSDGERIEFKLEMHAAVRVEGKLSDDVPRPVKNGRVVAEVIDYEEGFGNLSWRVWAKVNENGTFTLEGLPKGDLQVIAICDGYMAESGEPPKFVSGNELSDSRPRPQVFKLEGEVTPITVEMTQTGGARFRILGPDGEPVEGAKVGFWPNVKWWGNGSQVYGEPLVGTEEIFRNPKKAQNAARTHGLFSATTQEDGIAFIKSLPPGKQEYTIQHNTLEMPLPHEDSTYRWDATMVTAGEITEVTVTMQPQGTEPLEQRPLPSAKEEDTAADDSKDSKSQSSNQPDDPALIKTFTGHKSKAWAVAFSPNGKLLASGAGGTLGNPGEFKLWDIETGREIISIGKPRSVRWVDFAPGGATVVLAMHDNTAQVLNVPTCEVRHTLEGHSSGLDTAIFSPDGTLIATSSWDGTAKIWDARTGKELKTLDGHDAEVYFVAFSPDSQRVVTTSGDDLAKIWEVESGKELLTLSGHEDLIHCAAFSPDGKRIATASWDKTVRIWDAENGKPIETLEGHSVQALAVAFSPDGRWIASVSGRWGDYNYDPGPGELILWNAETFKKAASVAGHDDRIFAVAFSPENDRIATASWDQTIKLWDVAGLIKDTHNTARDD